MSEKFNEWASARVATDRPARYAKQLAAHMGRKIDTDFDAEKETGYLHFPDRGRCELNCADDHLVLDLFATEDDGETLEEIIGDHLARFGAGDNGLVVRWMRSEETPGTEQGPYTKEEVAERMKNRSKQQEFKEHAEEEETRQPQDVNQAEVEQALKEGREQREN